MTAKEKIYALIKEHGPDTTQGAPESLIVFAYYMGCEITARQICDEHNRKNAAMREWASKQRYHFLANSAINAGGEDQIRSSHYANDVLETFGGDEIKE